MKDEMILYRLLPQEAVKQKSKKLKSMKKVLDKRMKI